MQAPPKCDCCQTLLAIQQEQPHRVETAFSSPPSSADDGLDAGPEIIRKPRDSNVTNLVLSLFIMIMICMVSNICDTSIAQGLLSKTAALANRCSMPSEPVWIGIPMVELSIATPSLSMTLLARRWQKNITFAPVGAPTGAGPTRVFSSMGTGMVCTPNPEGSRP